MFPEEEIRFEEIALAATLQYFEDDDEIKFNETVNKARSEMFHVKRESLNVRPTVNQSLLSPSPGATG